MSKLLLLVVAFVAATCGEQTALKPDQQKFDEPVALLPIERFAGRLTVRSREGRPEEIAVAVRTWSVRNRQRVAVPERGLLLVQVRGGRGTFVVNNERREHKEDDFFAVPAGTTLTVETGNDTVALTVVAITGQRIQ